ncbi:MAG: hypothetical protein L6Q53_08545 [Candidatus Brocadia sinica]|nr:hypothetical protein [Candidatus Brocadia sinica]NUO03888.1 hypothetical protein [Candidatus Brocadia sinica]
MILAQITPTKIPDNPKEWSWYLVALAVGGAIGWGIKTWRDKEEIRKLRTEVEKLNAEIRKLNAEEIKLAGDILREVQRSRDAYSNACTACGEYGKKMIALLQEHGDYAAITEQRNEFGKTLGQRAIPALCSLVEWQALSRKTDTSALIAYIREDVVPELGRLQSWVQIVNLPVFTQAMSLSPLQIQERTMRPFFDLVRFVPEDRHGEIKELLHGAIRKVMET